MQVENYPRDVVSRHSNWGFVLASLWVCYTSFPMPARGRPSRAMGLDDKSLQAQLKSWQLREATVYNTDAAAGGSGSEEEGEGEGEEEE